LGTNGADTINGDTLNNIIDGSKGNDILNGNDGDDTLIGGTGNDALNGGDGVDTVSYAAATSRVIVDLSAQKASRTAKIMPLGDSITKGVVESLIEGSVNEQGGYRTKLWQKFTSAQLSVDFVGSQSLGSDSLGDKDHEGHGGKSIAWIDDNITGFLTGAQPDVVLLMAGTNDTGGRSVAQMISDLSALIDKITTFSPDLRLFVASIPPINSAIQPQERADKVPLFNAQLPELIATKKNQGQAVEFVDMTSLTLADISKPTVDNGLHPNDAGYQKIANFWYDALFKIGTEQGTYKVDRDTLNSIENIVGSEFSDNLIGNSGVNVIEGKGGRDRLTGKGGADTFVYQTPDDGGDTITDFGSDDLLQISASGFGGGLVAGVSLSSTPAATGTFIQGSNPLSTSTNAHFLYNTSTGVLSFDVDGIGAIGAVAIAMLSNKYSLTLNQIQIQ
jgi:Ca2+-binding RTX toxin-like protein